MVLVLYKNEVEEIRAVVRHEVHKEMAELEAKIAHNAGKFNYLLSYGGLDFFAHKLIPGAQVLRYIPHT